MTFRTVNSAMSSAVITVLGEPVTHHSHKGTVHAVYAVVEENVEVFPGGFDSGVTERTNKISMLKTDVPDLKRDDLIVTADALYTVQDIIEDDGVVIEVSAR